MRRARETFISLARPGAIPSGMDTQISSIGTGRTGASDQWCQSVQLPQVAEPTSTLDMYMCTPKPKAPERLWLDVKVGNAPAGNFQQEDAVVRQIALEHLAEQGVSTVSGNLTVLHAREFHYSEEAPDRIERSKLFIVLVGSSHLVSIHEGNSPAVETARSELPASGGFDPRKTGLEIALKTLGPVHSAGIDMDRHIGKICDSNGQNIFPPEDLASLQTCAKTVRYVIRKLEAFHTNVIIPAECMTRHRAGTDEERAQFDFLKNKMYD